MSAEAAHGARGDDHERRELRSVGRHSASLRGEISYEGRSPARWQRSGVGPSEARRCRSRPDARSRSGSLALASGIITGYRKIMFNDFVIVGPRDDPAAVAHAADAVDAMRRIAASGAVFASRGDSSGTYSREQELWALAKQRPTDGRLLETGQGMSATLRVASEKRAYTLTDRATFEQVRSGLQLASWFEGGPALLNMYSIFLRVGLTGADREAATTLADWLADGEGRELVAGFLANGRAVFNVWPTGIPRDQPTDLPDAR